MAINVRTKAIPLYLFSFAMILPMSALFPLLPMIRDEMSASYFQISIFIASIGIVRSFFAFPSGFMVDKFNRKKILILSGILSIAGLLTLSFSNSLFQLIASRILVGLGSIICTITILVILSEMYSTNGKGAMMSMNNVAHSAGSIVSPAMAGVLAMHYGWRFPFLVIAGLILASLFLIQFTFYEKRKKKVKKQKKTDIRLYLKNNLKTRFFQLFPVFLISFYIFFYRSSFKQTLIPFLGKDVFNIGVATLGVYISLMGVVAMISFIVFGSLSDIYGRKAIIILGSFFSMAAIMALFLPKQFNPLLFSCILVGVGSVINSMPNVLISDMVPSGSLGRFIGLNRIFSDGGYFLGAITIGFVLDRFGFNIPLYILAIFSLIILILTFFSLPKIKVKTKKIFPVET